MWSPDLICIGTREPQHTVAQETMKQENQLMISIDQYRTNFVINKNPTFIENSLSLPNPVELRGILHSKSFRSYESTENNKDFTLWTFIPFLLQLRVDHMQINHSIHRMKCEYIICALFCFGSFTLISLSLLVFLFRFAYHNVGRLCQRSNFTHLTVYAHSMAKKNIDYFYGFAYFTIRDLQSSNVPYMCACFSSF